MPGGRTGREPLRCASEGVAPLSTEENTALGFAPLSFDNRSTQSLTTVLAGGFVSNILLCNDSW